MAKYLDSTGVSTLWSKIKSTFLTQGGGDGRYLMLSGGQMSGCINTKYGAPGINFRTGHDNYNAILAYYTPGNEAIVLGLKNTVTSFIVKSGVDLSDKTDWQNTVIGTPSIQVKGQSLYVNGYIANGASPEYNLYVDGTSYITGNITAASFTKSGGTSNQFLKADGSVDSNSYSTTAHNHDGVYLRLSGGTMTGPIQWSTSNGSGEGGWNIRAQGIQVLYASGWDGTGAPYSYATALHVSGTYWFQLCFERGGNNLHWRGGNDSTTWGWNKIWDANNFNPSNYSTTSHNHDSTYLPLSGGTITGTLRITHRLNIGYDVGDWDGNRAELELITASDNANDFWMGANSARKWGLSTRSSRENYALQLYNSDLTPTVRVQQDGNVGIGTNSPGYKLDVSGSLNATTIYQNGTQVSVVGHTHSYLPLSGGTVTGNLRVQGTVFAYRYSTANGSSAPAIVYDKPGGSYTGIGCHGTEDTIWFGAVDGNFDWNDSKKQIWDFNGTIKQQGVALGSRAFDSTNYLPLSGGTLTGNLTATNSYIKAGGNGLQYPIRITRAYNDSVDFLIGSASSEAGSSSALNMRISNNSSGGGGEVYIDLLSGGGGVNIYPSLTVGGYGVITSSNIGSQSVNYASSAGSVAWSGITGKPSTFTPSDHNHSYLKLNYSRGGESTSGAWSKIKNGTSNPESNKVQFWTIYNDGGPTTWGEMLEILSYNSNHWQPQLWFGSGKGAHLYYRNKNHSDDTWGDWLTIIDSGNYTSYTVTKSGAGASGTWGINITGSAGSVAWGNVTGKPSTFTPSSHTHDDRYYTESESDSRYVNVTGDSMSGALSIQTQTKTKSSPVDQQLVINGPNYNASDTLTLQSYPGIGFHMPSRTWANLIWNGYFTGVNSSFDGYVGFYGSGFTKNGSSDSYVLLGGGGHKAESSLSVSYATNSGTATTSTILLTNDTSQNADACYNEAPGLRFWRYNGTSSTTGQSGGDGWILSWSWSSGSVGGQIYLDDNPTRTMCIRGRNNDTNKTFTTWATFLHTLNHTALSNSEIDTIMV